MKLFGGRITIDFRIECDDEEELYEKIQRDLNNEEYTIRYIDTTDEEDLGHWEDNYGN